MIVMGQNIRIRLFAQRNRGFTVKRHTSLKALLQNELGVGLIEMLVCILIMSGVLAAMLVASTTLPGTSNQTNAQLVLQQEASLAMEDMAKAIRQTTADPDTSVAGQLIADGITYNVSGNNLMKNGDLILGDYTFASFGMRVASLSFTDNSPARNTITINLSVNLTQTIVDNSGSTVTNIVDILTLTTQAYPRNR